MTISTVLVLAATVFAGTGEYDRLQRQVDELDAAADLAWENCSDRSAFEKRKAAMRKAFIDGIGGFPERTPLNARTTAVVKRDGYTIEKVLFESQPKLYVTALAFVPDPAKFKAPYPAVIVPCGHSRGGKDSAGYQRACVMGAREGFLMLIYDPIDQGERAQSQHDRHPGAALRRLDCPLPDLGRYPRARLSLFTQRRGRRAPRLHGQLRRRHAHFVSDGA